MVAEFYTLMSDSLLTCWAVVCQRLGIAHTNCKFRNECMHKDKLKNNIIVLGFLMNGHKCKINYYQFLEKLYRDIYINKNLAITIFYIRKCLYVVRNLTVVYHFCDVFEVDFVI